MSAVSEFKQELIDVFKKHNLIIYPEDPFVAFDIRVLTPAILETFWEKLPDGIEED